METELSFLLGEVRRKREAKTHEYVVDVMEKCKDNQLRWVLDRIGPGQIIVDLLISADTFALSDTFGYDLKLSLWPDGPTMCHFIQIFVKIWVTSATVARVTASGTRLLLTQI